MARMQVRVALEEKDGVWWPTGTYRTMSRLRESVPKGIEWSVGENDGQTMPEWLGHDGDELVYRVLTLDLR